MCITELVTATINLVNEIISNDRISKWHKENVRNTFERKFRYLKEKNPDNLCNYNNDFLEFLIYIRRYFDVDYHTNKKETTQIGTFTTTSIDSGRYSFQNKKSVLDFFNYITKLKEKDRIILNEDNFAIRLIDVYHKNIIKEQNLDMESLIEFYFYFIKKANIKNVNDKRSFLRALDCVYVSENSFSLYYNLILSKNIEYNIELDKIRILDGEKIRGGLSVDNINGETKEETEIMNTMFTSSFENSVFPYNQSFFYTIFNVLNSHIEDISLTKKCGCNSVYCSGSSECKIEIFTLEITYKDYRNDIFIEDECYIKKLETDFRFKTKL